MLPATPRCVLSSALLLSFAGCASVSPPSPVVVASSLPAPAAMVTPAQPSELAGALQRDDPETAAQLARPQAEAGNAEGQFVLGLLQDMGAGIKWDQGQARVWLEKSAGQGYDLARGYLAWKYEVGFGVDKADAATAALLRSQVVSHFHRSPFDRWISDGQNFVPNFARAFLWMSDAASRGDILAQTNLAAVYLGGPWTQPNSSLHIHWLKQAADQGDIASLERLALYCTIGLLLPKDHEQAFRYREAAAKAGSADSQFVVGQRYEDGDGVQADPAKAVPWYRLAAKQDHVDAIVRLENLLRAGAPGVEPDAIESLQWARRGAELGNAEALADEAGMLRDGRGAPRDLAAAAKLYEQSAQKGYAYGASMLGRMHLLGEVSGTPDYGNARHWFEIAAAKGNAWSMQQLGVIHENGRGVEKDPAQAFLWYERAAREGDGWSQNHVGWMLRQGIGVERDEEEAVTWFRLAAKNGEPLGDANLGYHYLQGLGVPRDLPQALEHLIAATRQLEDPWVSSNFLTVFGAGSEATQRVLFARVQACTEEPDFLDASGSLPELSLLFFETTSNDPRATQAAKNLLQRMASSDRRQSRAVLAFHAFIGRNMPCDPDRAHAWAEAAATDQLPGGERTLAEIDSICAPSYAARETARAKLHELADDGDGRAAWILFNRSLTGLGEPYNPKTTEEYAKKITDFHSIGDRLFVKQVSQFGSHYSSFNYSAIDEKVFASRVARVEAERGENVTCPPEMVDSKPPSYPLYLRLSGCEGKAEVEFIVTADGLPSEVHCRTSSHPLFALSAENCIKNWRFAPGRKNGVAVASRMIQEIVFHLKD